MAALAKAVQEGRFRRYDSVDPKRNVVFVATQATATGSSNLVSKQIRERFSYDLPVVIRTLEELRRAVANNPFTGPEADTS
ncbi:MAG: DUF1697 domain-containing protein [Planctomycetes bacterium]|nr:DUF1697 domain-containing protein [Planctomycetota bacterium]